MYERFGGRKEHSLRWEEIGEELEIEDEAVHTAREQDISDLKITEITLTNI